jgi:SpoVK/Ycf46/Vps4 family AAA+-type ATPase
MVIVEHLSEVVKILEAALRHDPRKAIDYANLLASKLESDDQGRQANVLRTAMAKSPAPSFSTSGAGASMPRDRESQLHTVDVLQPSYEDDFLVLHPYVQDKVEEFLVAVDQHEKWAAAGVATPNRLLLYGPPGTGKTSIARLIARRLGLPLLTTRSDALVSSLLGQTSRNIRQVFDYAESHPAVLLLDEFDALAKNRADAREIGELQRVVIALLQNIDALSSSTILVAATNHQNLLDPAVWRRFEHTIQLPLPSAAERAEIWRAKLGRIGLASRDLDILVRHSAGLSGAAIQTAAYDIVRFVLSESSSSDDPNVSIGNALRRLARILWHSDYDRFESTSSEIVALRNWAPDVFTIRTLSELFAVSTRQVTNALKGGTSDGTTRTDSASAGAEDRGSA